MNEKKVEIVKKNYLPRLTDITLEKMLNISKAVLIEGPKWCGKTWTGIFYSSSWVDFSDTKTRNSNISLAKIEPETLLSSPYPKLIDEWQEYQPIWDDIRSMVNFSQEKGYFILTGSVSPKKKEHSHSGAGRIERMKMFPMTINESEKTECVFSLGQMFLGDSETECKYKIKATKFKLKDLITFVIRGGWPENIGFEIEEALIKNKGYIDSISTEGILKQSGVRMDKEKFNCLIKSIGRNISTCAAYSTIHNDVNSVYRKGINDKTFAKYLQTLKDMFLFVELNAFQPNLRSKTRLQSVTKKILIDPSLACAALNLTYEKFLNDLNFFGFFFENLVLRDLLVYASVLRGQLFHYRDNSGLEVDCILELDSGEYAAIEIKTGNDKIDEAIKHIKLFKQKMVNGGFKEPKASLIIVGTGAFLHKEEGIWIVPLEFLTI